MPPSREVLDEFVKFRERYYTVSSCEEEFATILRGSRAVISPRDTSTKLLPIILEAKKNRSPFSIIRLNDGEGNLISQMYEGYKALYDYCIDKIFVMMFGRESIARKDLEFIRKLVIDSVGSADAIGLPERSRVLSSYKNSLSEVDVRGMMGIKSIPHSLFRLSTEKIISLHDKYLVSGWFARELLEHFESILDSERIVGYIGCYSDLPKKLCRRFNISEVDFYPIPPQPSNVHITSSSQFDHYPKVFSDNVQKIKAKYPGQIFLVSAGLLGKVYCKIIKDSGGIAIDIGSIADLWMGERVRPWLLKANFDSYVL